MDTIILRLEHEIASFIGTDNGCTVHFEYEEAPSNIIMELKHEHPPHQTVSAYTVNPKSEETFLLKSETDSTKEKALKKILQFIKEQKG